MPIRRADSALTSFARTFGGLALLTTGFLATLGTLLGFFGNLWWAFDAMANLRLQYAIVLIVTGILYGLILGRTTAIVFLAAAVVNVFVLLPLYFDSPARRLDDVALNVITLNVQSAGSQRTNIIEYLAESNAGLVFLQETTEDWGEDLATEDFPFQITTEIPPDRVYGMTVLSTGDVEVESFTSGAVQEQVLRVESAVGDYSIVLYAVHARTPTSPEGAAARDEVLNEVARRARDETLPVVVVGDFKATPWSHAFRDLQSTADLVDSTRGFGYQPTWPGSSWIILALPVDHLLHSPELTTVDRRIGPDLGSSHRPLLVQLARAGA
jgi:endonuclease/exonuclease/phosphatase (EEP) superfamily protein YafD